MALTYCQFHRGFIFQNLSTLHSTLSPALSQSPESIDFLIRIRSKRTFSLSEFGRVLRYTFDFEYWRFCMICGSKAEYHLQIDRVWLSSHFSPGCSLDLDEAQCTYEYEVSARWWSMRMPVSGWQSDYQSLNLSNSLTD